MKVRRVERFSGAIMRCRDCRLVRAGKPRAAKSEGKNATVIVKSRSDVHVSTNFPALRVSGMCKIPRFSDCNFIWGATNSRGSRYGARVVEATSMVDN